MSSRAPLSLAVVAEAPSDLNLAAALADRVFREEITWLQDQPELLDHCRAWRGLEEHDPYLDWHHVHRLARERNIRVLGKFGERSALPDAQTARKALLLLHGAARRPDAVVLVRDTDGEEARAAGLRRAHQASHGEFHAVVIAAVHPKRECWVLAGFSPADADEQLRLDCLAQQLGFDPCTRAEALLARTPGSKTDAKRVLSALTRDDREREARCWEEPPLALLAARGAGSGLRQYLQDVSAMLVPLLR